MSNKVLQKILDKKEITTNDKIIFRTIFDVLSALFTDENHVSFLNGWKINDHQQVWFPNISPDNKKDFNIKSGYANYMSENWNQIYQFDGTKDIEKRKKLGKKLIQERIQLITFTKLNEKSKGIGYHFVGVFIFDGCKDDECQTMIYKKISDSYQLKK